MFNREDVYYILMEYIRLIVDRKEKIGKICL